MNDSRKYEIVKQYIKDICHYSQMQVFATSAYQKKFLQYQIDEATEELTDFFMVQQNQGNMPLPNPPERKGIRKRESR